MTITREIYVTRKTLPNPIEYVQGTNALPIVFTFADYTIPEGTAAKVYVEKPSGYCQYDIASITDNTVVVDVKDTMFDEVGTSNLQIKLTKDDKTLITFDYPVRVSKNRVAGNIPQSGNNSDLIDELLARGEPAVEAAEAAADRANAAADRVDGTDVGTLTAALEAHTNGSIASADGVHGFRFSNNRLQYNAANPDQPASWQDAITKAQLLDMVYPVGSLYLTVSTMPPGGLFGGSWELWGKGRAIVGVDTSDTDFSTAEKTGGEKKHKLTKDEMPVHTHIQDPHRHNVFTASGSTSAYWFSANSGGVNVNNYAYTTSETATNQNAGGDQPHNNMPPYITCYIWKRTA